MSEGRISLKIETEVSELTNSGAVTLSSISIPRTEEAYCQVDGRASIRWFAGDGWTFSPNDVRQNIDGFPGLKDLPVLGTLFRSRDYIKEETELVVIVTPYPGAADCRKDLAKPIDGLANPTDRKANFLGHLNAIYGRGSSAPVGDLKGDYGFIVD